jgi:hypothetical protein
VATGFGSLPVVEPVKPAPPIAVGVGFIAVTAMGKPLAPVALGFSFLPGAEDLLTQAGSNKLAAFEGILDVVRLLWP